MADGIRKIARAFYDRSGEEEKREGGRFFDALDSNGDGKVSLREFQKGSIVEYRLSNDRVFKELRSNADGTMSFDDVLVLFYIKKGAMTILPRDECDELIFGPSFTSNSGNNRHTICCLCYGRGKSIQPPRRLPPFPSKPTPANLSLVKYTKPIKNAKKMKELREIAELHYHSASPRMRRFADEFFKSMDSDGDHKVSVWEFQSFMVQKGYRQLLNPELFDELGVGRTGTLGFWDVMTLYYIIKSGRPNCDLCKKFIARVFFTCVRCFKKGRSFNLCPKCYKVGDFSYHVHTGGAAHFLDNYTLLQTVRESSVPRHHHHYHYHYYNHDHDHDQRWADQPSSSSAMVPATSSTETTQIDKMDLAYKGLELVIAICNMAGNIAVTAGNMADYKCTIL